MTFRRANFAAKTARPLAPIAEGLRPIESPDYKEIAEYLNTVKLKSPADFVARLDKLRRKPLAC